jgi:serine/threonine protein kinase
VIRSLSVAINKQTGIVLERCIGSLDDIMKTDCFFDGDMTLKCHDMDMAIFDWQPSSYNDPKFTTSLYSASVPKLSSASSSSSSQSASARFTFRDLSIATCRRLLSDLRDPTALLRHMHHLCKCVEFLHSKYIIHSDLKLHNVFVRALNASDTCVNELQLVLADFDISALCKRNEVTNEIDTTGVLNGTGTYGYHEHLYHDCITFDEVLHNKGSYWNKYKQKYPLIYPGVDVFSLGTYIHTYIHTYIPIYMPTYIGVVVLHIGMIFLTMIYRCKLNTILIANWIKYQLEHQKTMCTQCQQDKAFKCSPAHIMLHHTYITKHATEIEKKHHARVIKSVLTNEIPSQLCDLLHRMTSINPDTRVTIKECVQQLDALLKK